MMDSRQTPKERKSRGRPRSATAEYENLAKRLIERSMEEMILINDVAELQGILRKVVTSLAYLSLTWSTVVLLGGFVSVLKLIDFWFLTAISTSFAINLADWYEGKTTFLYAAIKVYIAGREGVAQRFQSWGSFIKLVLGVVWFMLEAFVGVLAVAASVVFEILAFSPLVAIVLSLVRLAVHSYGNADATPDNAVKLKASLQIFYSLALAQNILFCLWSLFQISEPLRAGLVRRQCGFGKWGFHLVFRYTRETRSICTTLGEVPRGRNLATFAIGLLGSAESLDDRLDGVRMLDRLVAGGKVQVAPKLLPCKVAIDNLMEALEVGDGKSRERAARVVVSLAADLRHIEQFPTALDHIASLLQASEQKMRRHGQACGHQLRTTTTTTTTTMVVAVAAATDKEEDEHGVNVIKQLTKGPIYLSILYYFNLNRVIRILQGIFMSNQKIRSLHDDDDDDDDEEEEEEEEEEEGKQDDISASADERKRLISQGLLIIERLALHQGNRVHICNNHVLVSKLTAPLNSYAFLDVVEHDSDWIDMVGTSLRILASLIIRAPGEAGRGLRDGIARNTQAVANLTGILEDDKFGPALKTTAISILAELASSDMSATSLDMNKFISRLWGIFLAERDDDNTIEEEQQLRHKAGEALAYMLSVWDAAARSSDILQKFVQSTTAPSIMKYKVRGSSSEEVLTAALRHVVGQLTDMLIKSKSPRTVAARVLDCLCSHLSTRQRELPSQDVIEMLTKVLQLILQIPCETNKLEMAVQVMICSPGETNNGTGVGSSNNHKSSSTKDEEQQEEKEFLVALLSLAVAICDRMVDAHDFTCATATPQDMVNMLVKKLKDIIQTNNTTTVKCLRTVKLTYQLVVSMVQLKPMCIKEFTEQKFEDVLSESSKSLTDLDNCLMLFDADDHDQVTKTDNKPLVTLVKQAQELFYKAPKPSNVLS